MTLSVICKSCRKESRFLERVEDRVQLARKRGEIIELDCKKCGRIHRYHVDEVTAETNRLVIILSSIILLFGTPAAFYVIAMNVFKTAHSNSMIGLISAGVIPVLIYSTIAKSQQDKRNIFNRYRIKLDNLK